MFAEMRNALSIPKSTDILDHIRSLPTNPDDASDDTSSPQSRAHDTIRAIESRAMTSQRPQPGLVELMSYLSSRAIKKALCTRNFPTPVHHLLGKYLHDEVFEPIITRETIGVAPKPSPEGLWKIVKEWADRDYERASALLQESGHDPLDVARKVLGEGVIMVGDSLDDMAAGFRAGAATVLLVNEENKALAEHEYTDLSIRRLDDLIQMLEEGFVGRGPPEK
jgi:phosphoglycolate phosphatase-like HAD superfamily hydrolase